MFASGQLAVGWWSPLLCSRLLTKASHQPSSGAGSPMTWLWDEQRGRGWSYLGSPSCTHNLSEISSWLHIFFFSFRKLEVLSISGLTGEKTTGE